MTDLETPRLHIYEAQPDDLPDLLPVFLSIRAPAKPPSCATPETGLL